MMEKISLRRTRRRKGGYSSKETTFAEGGAEDKAEVFWDLSLRGKKEGKDGPSLGVEGPWAIMAEKRKKERIGASSTFMESRCVQVPEKGTH